MAQNIPVQESVHETPAPEGVFASLGINGQLFLFQLINFALVAAVVWFLILRPLVKKMEERRQLVNDSLDKAKEVETALAMSEIKFQERIDEAKVEANKIVAQAHEEAVAAAESMKTKAKREIQLLIDQAKRNIQIERDDALRKVHEEGAALIASGVQKILGSALDEKKDRTLIQELLKKEEKQS